MKECSDATIAHQLTDYYSGHLTYDQSQRVRNHLNDCESCRESLRAMELIGGGPALHSEKEAGGHLSAEQISAYYLEDSSLSANERSQINAHLTRCDQCAYDFAYLKDFETDIRASIKHAPRRISLLQRALSFVIPVVRHPALAYFLLLLTIYPTYQFLRSGDPGSGEPGAPATWQIIAETNRSAGSAGTIARTEQSDLVRVEIRQFNNPDLFHYTARITAEADSTRTIPVYARAEGGEKVRLVIDVRNLPDGFYRVWISESEKSSPNNTVHHGYLMELRTTP